MNRLSVLYEYDRAVDTGEAFVDAAYSVILAQHPEHPQARPILEIRAARLERIAKYEADGDLASAVRTHTDAWRTAALLNYVFQRNRRSGGPGGIPRSLDARRIPAATRGNRIGCGWTCSNDAGRNYRRAFNRS